MGMHMNIFYECSKWDRGMLMRSYEFSLLLIVRPEVVSCLQMPSGVPACLGAAPVIVSVCTIMQKERSRSLEIAPICHQTPTPC